MQVWLRDEGEQKGEKSRLEYSNDYKAGNDGLCKLGSVFKVSADHMSEGDVFNDVIDILNEGPCWESEVAIPIRIELDITTQCDGITLDVKERIVPKQGKRILSNWWPR